MQSAFRNQVKRALDTCAFDNSPDPSFQPDSSGDPDEYSISGSHIDRRKAIREAARCIECGRCLDACPVQMDVQAIIRSIADGEFEEAVRTIYKANPLARVCGRICSNHCESACAIGMDSKPVPIRALVRYAVDTIGQENVRAIAAEGSSRFRTGKRVAIIGSGPAGLTAAYDLVRKGHCAVIYESNSDPGGMMHDGVLQSRVPREPLDNDIDAILSLGIDLRLNMKVGRNMTMEKLRGNFDAVLVAGGLYRKHFRDDALLRGTRVVSAINLLCDIANCCDSNMVPKTAGLVGDDNVSLYLANEIARCQMQQHGRVAVTVYSLPGSGVAQADAARLRQARKSGVTIVALDAAADIDLQDTELVVETIGQKPDVSYLGETIVLSLERLGKHARTLPPSVPWLWTVGDMVVVPDIVQAIAAGHQAAERVHDTLMGIYRYAAN